MKLKAWKTEYSLYLMDIKCEVRKENESVEQTISFEVFKNEFCCRSLV